MNIHAPQLGMTATNAPKPLVSVIDSSMLFSLFAANGYALSEDHEYDPMQWLHQLSTPPRTMVIPRTVLQELYVKNGKSYGIYHDPETNESGFVIPERTVKNSGARRFRQFLLDAEANGTFRYFPSTAELLSSGELDAAKGGVIIVDSADKKVEAVNASGTYNALPKGGQTADEALHHFLHKAYDLDTYGRKTNAHITILSNDNGVIETCDRYVQGASPRRHIYAYNTRSMAMAASSSDIINKQEYQMLFDADFLKCAKQEGRRVDALGTLLKDSVPEFVEKIERRPPSVFVSNIALDTQEAKHGVSIMDTSMLERLLNAPKGTLNGFKGYDGSATLAHLSEGNRTLILPHTALRELLVADKKSYGMYKNGDGSLGINLGERSQYSKSGHALAYYLNYANRQGKVRLYDSVEAMERAGECDGVQGPGIVIVNACANPDASPLNNSGTYPKLQRSHYTSDAIKNMVQQLSNGTDNSNIVVLTHNLDNVKAVRRADTNTEEDQRIQPYMFAEMVGAMVGQGWISHEDADQLCKSQQGTSLVKLQAKHVRRDTQTRLETWIRDTEAPAPQVARAI